MRKTWLTDTFGTEKAAVGVLHLKALPTDPLYDKEGGMKKVIDAARYDLHAMQDGGIDGILFSNEFSFPYVSEPSVEVISALAYVIGCLSEEIEVPYGVGLIGDTDLCIGMNAACGGTFMRGSFGGAFAGNDGICTPDAGKLLRHRHALGLDDDLKMVHYVNHESCGYLGGLDYMTTAKSAVFGNLPDALGVTGECAGKKIPLDIMKDIKNEIPDMVYFATTGVTIDSFKDVYSVADGAFIASHFKVDGVFENPVDPARVKAFMDALKEWRADF